MVRSAWWGRRSAVAIALAGISYWSWVIAADPAGQPASQPKGPRFTVTMPGKSFAGPLPQLDARQTAVRDSLKSHVQNLAGEIGERNVVRRPNELDQAADYIEKTWTDSGLKVSRQKYQADRKQCFNLDCEIKGNQTPDEIVLIGAHYDSIIGCPGANDNGSGMAGVLTLAAQFADMQPAKTLRFVAFTNEEPPYFQTRRMGSLVYAKACRQRKEKIVAMLSLETIGYYSDEKGSQQYPAPFDRFYPSTGNFIAFVGNVQSSPLVERVVGLFRQHAQFPSEGGAMPGAIQGVGWSDHWSFWQQEYPGLMVTDTAPFRYPHYHRATDTPDRLDYDRMARVVTGLQDVIAELAGVEATNARGE